MSHSTASSPPHLDAQAAYEPVPSDEPPPPTSLQVTQGTRDETRSGDEGKSESVATLDAAASRCSSASLISGQASTEHAADTGVTAKPDSQFEESQHRTCVLWLPYTLTRSYLAPLGILSLVLAIILVILLVYSTQHNGLVVDDGTVGLFFARRYVPTIIAVLITLAITVIAEDVKRTEPYSRMASRHPPPADYTLFYIPKVWWKSVFNGLSTKANGGRRSWVLSFASLAAGVVLFISTLSSSVFVTREILQRTDVQLEQYAPQQNGSIVLLPRRNTYTRTINGFLYNTSASFWVSDSHVIFPFITPSQKTNRGVLQNGTWEAESMVLKLGSTCVPMALVEKTDLNITFSSAERTETSKASRGIKLRSEDGCVVQLQSPIAPTRESNGGITTINPVVSYFTDDIILRGGILWTNLSSSHISWQTLVDENHRAPSINSGGNDVHDQWRSTFVHSQSEQCHGRDLLLVSPSWFDRADGWKNYGWSSHQGDWANFTARAELCTPKYSMATVPVTAAIGDADSRVFFDEDEFLKRQEPVPSDMLDLDRLNKLTFGQAWLKLLSPPGENSEIQGLRGIPLLLARTYSLDMESMLKNSTLPERASRLRSRFFTELIASSILDTDLPVIKTIAGKSVLAENLIVVVPGTTIALAVLLYLAACYSFAMLWYASNQRRPLNLESDPAILAGVAQLNIDPSLAADLRACKSHDRTEVQTTVGNRVYALNKGAIFQSHVGLSRVRNGSAKQTDIKTKHDWRPLMLRKTWLSCLLLGILAVAIALLILRDFATKNALFQTAFVREINISAANASFSPHAMIATLIAVVVGICWDSIDQSMRTLQPYLAQSRAPIEASQGLSVSYQSSYWIWASFKSAKNRHWLLCLITIGTTLSRILVISMAAIFERHSALHKLPTNLDSLRTTHSVRPRQEPFTYGFDFGGRPFSLTDGLLGSSNADWLYNALDAVTLDTTPLPWTKDEWIFTPVNVTNRDDPSMLYVALETNKGSMIDAAYSTSQFNVSLTTSALRGRLECDPVKLVGSGWMDTVHDVYPNRFNKSVNGFVLPSTLHIDSDFTAPVFSVPRRMVCCTSNKSPESASVLAYWSNNNANQDWKPLGVDNGVADTAVPSQWTKAFAIKWIVGVADSTLIPGNNPGQFGSGFGNANETVLYFHEYPQIAMLKCAPVIEQVNAEITIARDSAQILRYDLLGAPQPAAGAFDHVYDIDNAKSEPTRSQGNVSFGTFFISQLLTAPNIIEPKDASSSMVYNHTLENLAAERYNLRDTYEGINMDYMSYANFIQANRDVNSLLDTTTLQKHSQQTFQTFFKYFAARGNWTYGAQGSSRAAYEEVPFSERNEVKFNGTITERVEVLTMSEVATWLSLAISFVLIAVLVVLIVALQVIYARTSMLRNVECLADVLAMVAGSDRLVELIKEIGIDGIEKKGIETRLGWFRDKRGVARWGVEVVDNGVEWLDGPEKTKSTEWEAFLVTGAATEEGRQPEQSV